MIYVFDYPVYFEAHNILKIQNVNGNVIYNLWKKGITEPIGFVDYDFWVQFQNQITSYITEYDLVTFSSNFNFKTLWEFNILFNDRNIMEVIICDLNDFFKSTFDVYKFIQSNPNIPTCSFHLSLHLFEILGRFLEYIITSKQVTDESILEKYIGMCLLVISTNRIELNDSNSNIKKYHKLPKGECEWGMDKLPIVNAIKELDINTMLEISNNNGHSTIMWLELMPDLILTSVGSHPYTNYLKTYKNVSFIESITNEYYDLIFIEHHSKSDIDNAIQSKCKWILTNPSDLVPFESVYSELGYVLYDTCKLKSFAQYKQDIIVENVFFPGKRDGVFVEIGADDGIRISNTYLFERLGWTGLCIEARKSMEEKLRKNRAMYEIAVIGTKEKTIEFQEIVGYGQGLSGVIENYDSEHIIRIQNDIRHSDYKKTIIESRVVVPIDQIFEKHKITHIDYLTIDIEGGEFEIIQYLLSKKYHITVIQIENNYNKDYKNWFFQNGYKLVGNIKMDEIYVINSYTF